MQALSAAGGGFNMSDVNMDMLEGLAGGGGGDGADGGGPGGGGAPATAADMLARLQTGLRAIEQYAVRTVMHWVEHVLQRPH